MLIVEVAVVFVCDIGGPCRSVHVGCGLGVVVATSIDVVEDEAEVELLACIVREGRLHVVGTCFARAVPVVGDIHEG